MRKTRSKKKSTKSKSLKHHGDSTFTPIYLVIVILIAGIILFRVVKPLLSQQYEGAVIRTEEAVSIAKGAFVGISMLFLKRKH